MTKRGVLKIKKICVVCGGEFLGTAAKITCDVRCRTTLVRLKAAGKRPEYILIAKSKGQKIPDLNAPKRLKFKKGEKMKKPEHIETKINHAQTTESSYGDTIISRLIKDEAGLTEKAASLTKEQKLMAIVELERQRSVLIKAQSPMGQHPKMWRLNQNEKISAIDEQIKLLQ